MAESSWTIAERVARESRGRLVAILATKLGDLHAAEDALADAFAKALDVWPVKGVPEHPEAWLITVAQRGFIDGRRSAAVAEGHVAHLELLAEEREDAAAEDPRIALLFVCAHPAIDEHIRTPLMLQAVLGVNADAMAPLWLSKGSTIGQRLVRAKKKISATAIPFSVPPAHESRERLQSVLDAIYGALTIGGDELTEEAEYLAALLAAAFPEEPEALGLLSLCLFRMALVKDTAIGPLAERDTQLWDRDRIQRAETFLKRAAQRRAPGRFQLEAAIQSAHITGRVNGRQNHAQIIDLYRRLLHYAPTLGAQCSLIAALIQGGELREAGDRIASMHADAENYQPYWVVVARLAEAEYDQARLLVALEKAAVLATDEASRRFVAEWIRRYGPTEPKSRPVSDR